ncbi:DUF4234 domain-containing protein [Pseudoalteromonas sp. SG43-7]|uniref:DUF4234 domain-containing protein n=1 Tax=Pseudoalteromonas sp. SG43-7 TaxID=2760966 RepID=UPI0016012B16|nr:DUF4234 domain-containing protein [Pseudoalteromonas sp. SG43-7]MBB1422726.1 DUF4234 domain-containing protein [Pseudoalteromonas sp. SG43-7]
MSENTSNVYEAPAANLTKNNESGDKPVLNFDRFSAWGVFFLAVITFGIYGVYWLISRTNKANALATKQISQGLIYGYLALYVANLILSITEVLPVLSIIISLASILVGLIFIFSLRSSISELINKGSSEPVKLNGVLTFFFNIIYFQYKINEAIDQQK